MIDLFTDYKRFGIFGPSESGKSTLAKKISQEIFARERRFSIVLSPNDTNITDWQKPHIRFFRDKEKFLQFADSTNGCVVIVDDASTTIARDDECSNLFTTMRHRNHKLLVIGHAATNLLPQMREQLQRIFLFLQTEDSIKKWEVIFPGQDLMPATRLQQYEFLTVANYKPLLKSKLTK